MPVYLTQQVKVNLQNKSQSYTIEQDERKRREKNVGVYGIEESSKSIEKERKEDDKKAVTEICEKIGYSINIDNINRLKSKNSSKPGPIIVYLSDLANRNQLLTLSKKLRHESGCENIYMSPDLTQVERALDFELRKKRNEANKALEENSPFRYAIRGNQVVKFKKHW